MRIAMPEVSPVEQLLAIRPFSSQPFDDLASAVRGGALKEDRLPFSRDYSTEETVLRNEAATKKRVRI
jgi:hypothetical protein